MIAVDSSSLVDYLAGESGKDVDALDQALVHGQLRLPPVVLTEVLSRRTREMDIRVFIRAIPVLELKEGFWERTGDMRAQVIAGGRRAPLPDSLIAQVCIDHGLPLITRDADFKHYVRFGLKLFA